MFDIRLNYQEKICAKLAHYNTKILQRRPMHSGNCIEAQCIGWAIQLSGETPRGIVTCAALCWADIRLPATRRTVGRWPVENVCR